MRIEDRDDFLRVMNGMAAMKRIDLTDEVLTLWWACLEHWDIREFKAAAIQVLREQDWPSPKHFEDLRRQANPVANMAAESWQRVLQNVTSSNYARGVRLDPLTEQCVRVLGGYQAIARHDLAFLHLLERRFKEFYESQHAAIEVRERIGALEHKPAFNRVSFGGAA